MSSRTDALLDRLRSVGDPAADALIATLPASQLWAVSALLGKVTGNSQPLPDEVPEHVRTFLADHAALPRFTDPVLLLEGQRWGARNAALVVTGLFCASLPFSYAAARGAAVLAATRRMNDDIDRRIAETGRFVLDVLHPGGLGPSGTTIRAAQKVRLVHAAVRRHLRDVGRPGVEINQEDLHGTLLSFSWVVTQAVRRLGGSCSAREQDAFLHLWSVIGVLLGVDEGLLPFDGSSAEALWRRIDARNFQPSAHGQELTRNLITSMDQHTMLDGASEQLMAYLVGDRVASMLGLDAKARVRTFERLPAFVRRKLPSAAVRFAPRLGRQVLSRMLDVKLRGEKVTYPLPSFLRRER